MGGGAVTLAPLLINNTWEVGLFVTVNGANPVVVYSNKHYIILNIF